MHLEGKSNVFMDKGLMSLNLPPPRVSSRDDWIKLWPLAVSREQQAPECHRIVGSELVVQYLWEIKFNGLKYGSFLSKC